MPVAGDVMCVGLVLPFFGSSRAGPRVSGETEDERDHSENEGWVVLWFPYFCLILVIAGDFCLVCSIPVTYRGQGRDGGAVDVGELCRGTFGEEGDTALPF